MGEPSSQDKCWPSLQAQNPEYVLWNLGEDDQNCKYQPEYSDVTDAKECVQVEFIPEMQKMISEGSNMKHILVTPAPLIESDPSKRSPEWGVYAELSEANRQ